VETQRAIPLVDLKAQYLDIREDLLRVWDDTLHRMHLFLGPQVQQFERDFARYLGVRHVLGVGSGTEALDLALQALGVGPGDEVITTPFTFFATVEAILHVGARPVFVDIDPDTYTMDPDAVEAALTPRTRALLPVHLFGHPAPMHRLLPLARRHHLLVLEDAAQAHGARILIDNAWKPVGSLGDAAAFSFYYTKNLGAFGEGGAVATSRDEVAEKLRLLRVHGQTDKYTHTLIGTNSRLDELQAAVLNLKLPKLDRWNERRRALAARYTEALQDLDVITPVETPWAYHVYHLYVIRVPANHRDALREHLMARGIGVGIHYPIPAHLQPALEGYGYREGAFPLCERISREVLTLPMHPFLTDEEVDSITETIREYFTGVGA